MAIPAIIAALSRAGPALGMTGGSAPASSGMAALYRGTGAAERGLTGSGGLMSGLGDTFAGRSGQIIQTVGAVQSLMGAIGGLPTPLGLAESGVKKLHQTFMLLPSKVLEAKEMIVSTGRAWVEALAAPIKTVKELGDAVGQFVRLSNPGLIRIFEYKVENSFATIGRILEPIMNALTRAAEKVGDTFAKMKPAFEPAMKAVEELIDAIMTRFGDLAETLAPTIRMASTMFLALVEVIKLLQEPVTFLIRKFNELRRDLFEFLGIPTGFDKDAKSDIAIRPPQYTNTEALQREMARNSLMASLGPGSKPQTTESWLEKIHKILEQLSLENLKAKIVEALKEVRDNLDPRPDIIPERSDLGGFFERAGSRIEHAREEALAAATRARRTVFQE